LMCETRNNMSMKKPGNNAKRGNRKLSETVVEEQ
jgi:hypothetical protein